MMCGSKASGGVHFRGALRVGTATAAAFEARGVLARGALGALAGGGGGGGGAGIPCTHVDSGRSHRSQ